MHTHLVGAVAGMVACSASMLEAFRRAQSFAKTNDPMVITGPTGTGKSHLARLIHLWSGRPGRMAEVSARELQGLLAYDQLFGHERGGFTDAVTRRAGVFEEAGPGSVLLDDAHLLESGNQMMLLRALDSGAYRTIGSHRAIPIQARLLVGTQRDLDDLVRDGVLLPDFRYRLSFFEIHLAPLRHRREDIGPLAQHFLGECAKERGGPGPLPPAPDLVPVLELAPWPGNVRELKAALRFADWIARESGEREVRAAHLPEQHQRSLVFDPRSDRETKERLVTWALWRTGDHIEQAAELIRAHRNTVSAIRSELLARKQDTPLHNRAPTLVQSEGDSQSVA